MTTRQQDRAAFTDPLRIVLLEKDADDIERSVATVRTELTVAIDALRGEIRATRLIMTMLLVTVAGSSITLLITNAVSGHH